MKQKKTVAAGSIVALITPFRDGRVDEESLERLIESQIRGGTDALLPCGTTGESATLTHDEHRLVVELACRFARGRVPVIAGTGSNSTEEAIELTRHAASVGCDGALLICPYYNKPTQNGLIRHFTRVADEVDIPQIMYNIPGRTGVNMTPETMAALAEHPRIVGVKEASGNVAQITQLMALLRKKSIRSDQFAVVSGEDSLTYSILALGGTGVISAVANIAPKQIAAIVHAFAAGRPDRSLARQLEMIELIDTMFIETNPIPVKTACALAGMCELEFRLPLCEMTAANLARLKTVLRKYHVIR